MNVSINERMNEMNEAINECQNGVIPRQIAKLGPSAIVVGRGSKYSNLRPGRTFTHVGEKLGRAWQKIQICALRSDMIDGKKTARQKNKKCINESFRVEIHE